MITWVSAESERLYTASDLALAEDLAKRAAVAIDNAELHSETLATAVQLQHAVLPESMPRVPGWEIATSYSPAGRTDVGGDFYDAVPLDDGRLALFVGDVMGRGVAAAAAMAQMRAAVRAYTAIDPTPGAVMTNLDRMFAQYPTDQLVTLVHARGRPRPRRAGGDQRRPPATGAAAGRPRRPSSSRWPTGRRSAPSSSPRLQAVVPFHVGDTVAGLHRRPDRAPRRGHQPRPAAGPGRGGRPRRAGPRRRAAEVVQRLRDPARDDDVAALAVRRVR